jgi:hypothetical protein
MEALSLRIRYPETRQHLLSPIPDLHLFVDPLPKFIFVYIPVDLSVFPWEYAMHPMDLRCDRPGLLPYHVFVSTMLWLEAEAVYQPHSIFVVSYRQERLGSFR